MGEGEFRSKESAFRGGYGRKDWVRGKGQKLRPEGALAREKEALCRTTGTDRAVKKDCMRLKEAGRREKAREKRFGNGERGYGFYWQGGSRYSSNYGED